MRKTFSVLLTVFFVGFMLNGINIFSQSSDLVATGFARSRFAFQVDDGSLFINEQLLSSTLEWRADTATAHADFSLTAEDGRTVKPDLKELYVDWYGDSFDLRIGKQKVLWGKSDGVFITDLVSPKDLSAFLTKDIGELRLGVTGIKLDYFFGAHQIEAVLLPVFTPAVLPKAGSLWEIKPELPSKPGMTLKIDDPKLPEASLKNAEYFGRYSYLGSLLDFQVMGGWMWNDTPIATITGKPLPPTPVLTIQPEYYQVAVAGLAASLPFGPLVLKTEGSFTWNQRYQETFNPQATGWVEKNDIQYLVGGDISFAGATLSLQWIQDIVLDHDDTVVRDEMLNSMTAILQRSFNRETIRAEVFSVVNIIAVDEMNSMIKPQLTWIPGNGFQASLGGWFFLGEAGQFGQYTDNNGVYVSTAFYF